jgi:hypothetical protein
VQDMIQLLAADPVEVSEPDIVELAATNIKHFWASSLDVTLLLPGSYRILLMYKLGIHTVVHLHTPCCFISLS